MKKLILKWLLGSHTASLQELHKKVRVLMSEYGLGDNQTSCVKIEIWHQGHTRSTQKCKMQASVFEGSCIIAQTESSNENDLIFRVKQSLENRKNVKNQGSVDDTIF